MIKKKNKKGTHHKLPHFQREGCSQRRALGTERQLLVSKPDPTAVPGARRGHRVSPGGGSALGARRGGPGTTHPPPRPSALREGARTGVPARPRLLLRWQEVPANYKSRHAGNTPPLLPGNVLCPAPQEAPVRSQPGGQPVGQPVRQRVRLRGRGSAAAEHKGRRARRGARAGVRGASLLPRPPPRR